MANPTYVGWVAGPDGRGTLNIIWTCLSTLFLCLWASWHPDIPGAPSKKRHTVWRQSLQKFARVLFLLLIPEAGVAAAVYQFVVASRSSKTLRKAGYHQWTLQHCLYAEMGGIEVALATDGSVAVTADAETQQRSKVDCPRLLQLQRKGILPQDPPISGQEISQLSKSDFLVKAIALIQVAWFLIQAIARTAQGLPLANLEVVCLAYVFYAAVVYIAWWQKPLDTTTVVHMHVYTAQTENTDQRSIMLDVTRSRGGAKDMQSLLDSLEGSTWQTMGCAALFAIFGGIHCASWDSSFNSTPETWLWRTSSVVITIAYAGLAVVFSFEDHLRPGASDLGNIAGLSVLLLVVLYCIARMFIIVEAIIGLRRAPSSLYETVDWMKFLPHIA